MLNQVLRKFRAEGLDRKPGEILETSHWRNERLLLEHRFIGKVSVPQKDAGKIAAGKTVEEISPEFAANKNESKSESPVAATSGVVAGLVRPSVLNPMVRRPMPIVGRVPVAGKR